MTNDQREIHRKKRVLDKTPDDVVEKILHLRRTYHMGPIRIVWYLERYHDIKTSDATVHRVCKQHGLNRLPNRFGRRAVHRHRYEKRVPGITCRST